jgi:hypothetical protein
MKYPTDADIINLLTNDPLSSAEKVTGKSYKEDDATSSLGFMMSVHDNMVKKRALSAIGDTVFSMDWLAYCEAIEKFGFGLMVEDLSPDGGEAIRLYYNEKDGLLLRADSYHGNRNGATVYYNWQLDPEPNLKPKELWSDPDKEEYYNWWSFTSSGGLYYPGHDRQDMPTDPKDPAWKDIVWSGDHDAREALAFNMRLLRENGTFVPIWKHRPHMWLVAHWEKDQKDNFDQINFDRAAKLPQWVQDNIKGTE